MAEFREPHPADDLCGQNHDPQFNSFARKCWDAGRRAGLADLKKCLEDMRPDFAPGIAWSEGDYGEMAAYDRAIEELEKMLKDSEKGTLTRSYGN